MSICKSHPMTLWSCIIYENYPPNVHDWVVHHIFLMVGVHNKILKSFLIVDLVGKLFCYRGTYKIFLKKIREIAYINGSQKK